MKMPWTLIRFFILLPIFLVPVSANSADIEKFVGTYQGSAEIQSAGKTQRRDMSVVIESNDDGFSVSWTSVTYKSDGRTKQKTYTVGFVPTPRDNIFASAMKTNVFGKAVPLDPLKGEPFVWARFEENTFTVFSLFINEVGDYDMQEYHRTLVEGGLELEFRSLRNGVVDKAIRTFLKRE